MGKLTTGNYPMHMHKGKAIGLSVCCCCSRCPQKTGVFGDLQHQASREKHKTQKIGEKMMYLCSCLLLTIHKCNQL